MALYLPNSVLNRFRKMSNQVNLSPNQKGVIRL